MARGKEWDPAIKAELKAAVLDWVADGRTTTSFCRQHNLPVRTLQDWRREDEAFAAAFGACKDIGFDVIADDVLQIADTPQLGEIVTETEGGDEGDTRKIVRDDMLGHRKLQVEARLKLLACWDPRRYGNKVQVGGDGGEPIKVADKDAAVKELASILATAAARKET